MSIIDKIENSLTQYWNEHRREPLSIEVPRAEAEEIEFIAANSVDNGFERYHTEGDEIGRYRGIKIYVERHRVLKIK